GGKPIRSFYRTVTKDGRIYIRWTMPYRTSAKLTFINNSRAPVSVETQVRTQSWHWDANTLYFHAQWKKAGDIPIRKEESDKPIEWSFADIEGRGVFLGDTYAVYN